MRFETLNINSYPLVLFEYDFVCMCATGNTAASQSNQIFPSQMIYVQYINISIATFVCFIFSFASFSFQLLIRITLDIPFIRLTLKCELEQCFPRNR